MSVGYEHGGRMELRFWFQTHPKGSATVDASLHQEDVLATQPKTKISV